MTLIIENVEKKYVTQFYALAKKVNANIVQENYKADEMTDKEIHSFMCDYNHSNEKLETWKNEADETLKLYKQGKIKSYNNPQEMHTDIFKE